MRPLYRLAIVVLFGLVIGGATLAGLYAGRKSQESDPAAEHAQRFAPATTTDALIESYLGRIQRLPDNADAYTGLGAAYLQQARETGDPFAYARAESALTKSLALDAQNADTHVHLGVLAAARHRFEEALAHGQRARELTPYKAAALGVIGDAQLELGRYDEARETIQAMLDLRPDLASFSRMSYIKELYGDLPGAIELMKRAVIGAPGNEAHAWTQVQLGHLYFLSGDLAAAEREYERTLFQRPGYAHARAGVARVKAARGDFAGAIAIYEEITRAGPLPEYVIALADVQRAAGDRAAAERTESLLLAIDRLSRENGVNTDVEMALFRADRGIEPAQTVEDARGALAERPGVHAWDALAWALHTAGRHEEAQAASEQALRLGTRDPLLRYHAGMIALALGSTDRAREELRLAVGMNPSFSPRHAAEATAALRTLDAVTRR
jgi:tetratricopeptide (TPR) repeat protein